MKKSDVLFRTVIAVCMISCCVSTLSARHHTHMSRSGRISENWYMYFGAGYSFLHYPDEAQDALDEINDQPGVGHFSFSVDALGFYWPIAGNSTILGTVINFTGDNYSTDGGSNTFSVNQGMLDISVMHSLTDATGEGITLRADVGPAWLSTEYTRTVATTTTTTRSNLLVGFGFLVGAGYALPVSSETSLMFNAKYALRMIDDERFGAATIEVGVLF